MNAAVDPIYLRRSTETEAVRSLRRRIDHARSRCLKRAERALSFDAGQFMLRAAQIGSAWAFAAASQSQLEDVIALLSSLVIAANAAERLEAPDE